MDVFITLLSLGAAKYKSLLKERKEVFQYLREQLIAVASKHGERVLSTPNNQISIGNC